MTNIEKIIELVKELSIGELKALENALFTRRRRLETEHDATFKAINRD